MRNIVHARLALAACAALVALPAVAADIVKLRDAQGRVIYADRPLAGTTQLAALDREPSVAARKGMTPRQEIGWQPGAAKPVAAGHAAAARALAPTADQRTVASVAGSDSRDDPLRRAALTREAADRRLVEVLQPRPGESVRQPDGTDRLLPAYYERIAPYERESIRAAAQYEEVEARSRAGRR